jgi:hypothetical protein
VKRWHKAALAIGAVAGATVVGPRLLWFRRRRLPEGFVCETLDGNAACDDLRLAVARPPKRFLDVPHGLHADPLPALDAIIAWLDEVMACSEHADDVGAMDVALAGRESHA